MRFADWLLRHEGHRMRVWTPEVPTDDGSNCVQGVMHVHQDFVTIDQDNSGVVAIPLRAITSAVELLAGVEKRISRDVEVASTSSTGGV